MQYVSRRITSTRNILHFPSTLAQKSLKPPYLCSYNFFFISKNPSYIIWYIGHIENFQRAFLRSSTLVLKYPYSEVKFCKFKHVLVYNYYSTRIWANSIDFDTRFIFFSRRFSVYAWNFYIDANLLYKLFLVRLYSSKNDFLLSIQGYG